MDWETENKKQQASLEQELRSEGYSALLSQMRHDEPFFHRFETWEEVIGYMRAGTSRDPGKDEVLRPILRAHQNGQDHRWRAILLAIFWPGLISIHRQKRHWDGDIDERWQNVTWTFLEVLCRVDVRRRQDRLVQKLFNDTVHRLYGEYRRKWSAAASEFPVELDDLNALSGGVDDIDYAGIELRLAQAAEVRRLREHRDAGRISEADFLLLVGTRVYGKSAAEYARETGIDSALARQRRFRAEQAIRRHEGGA